jgi:hypothetical protein
LLGGLTTYCWALTANAMFDRSPPERRLVRIERFMMKTWNFLFRQYYIEYRIPGHEGKLEHYLTPQEIAEFDVPLGIAEIHAGWLGWRWVRRVVPAHLELPAEAPDDGN